MKNIKYIKNINIILLIVLILSIIPIVWMGFFARPLWDDFDSAFIGHKMLTEGNILGVIFAPLLQAISSYISWQGTYSAEMIFTLQPGSWIVPCYWLTTVLMIVSIFVGSVYFWRMVVNSVFNMPKDYGTLIALSALILQFQYLPYLHQGFYWYTGAVYYTFYLGLNLIEIAYIIKFFFVNEPLSKKKIRLLCVLIIFIEGGNYATAFINFLMMLTILVLTYFYCHKEVFKQVRVITIITAVSLIINMIAPGNLVRAAGVTSMSPPRAIYHSLKYAFEVCKDWTNLSQIGLIICLIPVIYLLVKNTTYKFRYPILVCGFMFGLFAAQMTPSFFAESAPGDTRQIDYYYYGYYILMICCLIYLEGWFIRKFEDKIVLSNILPMLIAGAIIIVIGVFVNDYHNLNAYKTLEDITSGNAEKWLQEYNAAIDILESDEDVVYLHEINEKTNSLDDLYLNEDPEHWINKGLANYYNKKQVNLKK